MRRLVRHALVVAGVCAASTAHGQQERRTLAQLEHTAFTQRNGAPAQVAALAQTTDGYLWLGTATGLYRFDGVTFEPYPAPPGQSATRSFIATLLALPDGALWIGQRIGGVSVLSRGRLTSYDGRDGLPAGTVFKLARDSAGVLWAATNSGAATFDGRRWTRVGAEAGLAGRSARTVFTDRRGDLWIGTDSGYFRRARGERRFIRQGDAAMVSAGLIAQGPDGSIWTASGSGPMFRLSDPDGGTAAPTFGPTLTGPFLIARDGALWSVVDGGVERADYPIAGASSRGAPSRGATSPAERFTRALGLSGALVNAMLEDREHDIWLATDAGLDRFRATKLVPTAFPWESIAPVLVGGARDSADGILVATWAHSLFRVRADSLRRFDAITSNLSVGTRAADGTVWVAGADGLWRVAGDSAEPVEAPRDAAGASVAALAVDGDGTLWYSAVRRGVYRRHGGAWTRFDTAAAPRPAIAIVADGRRVWLSYPHSELAMVDGSTVREYSRADGLDVGNVLAVLPQGGAAWVGGDAGIVRFAGGRFAPLVGADGDRLRGVSGIVERANGELWLNGADGITRIAASEVRAFVNDARHRVRYDRLDYHDGLRGVAIPFYPIPTLVEGGDGTLWFTTESAVLHLDPNHVLHNGVVPPVHLLAVATGDSTYAAADTVVLPPHTTSLSIRYTAPSLAVPERVRFRYQLVGVDTSWQDAGARREAFYTNLRPGRYHFRVIAANDDGVWNERGDAADVVIQPTFAQTRWFLVLCWAAGAGAVYLLYLMRLRFVAARMRMRFEATLAERTRIAQELHDTLLQGFTGITLHLHGILRTLGERPERARDGLAQVLEHADAALRDARRTVWDLNSRELESATLVEALAAAGRRATAGSSVELRLAVRGAERRLTGTLELTALRVGAEAVSNAVKHAGARAIDVDVEYGESRFTLRVRDDGRGLGDAIIDAAEISGHLGIAGMRERAARAGGTLDIRSASDAGTTLVLVLPIR